MAKEKPDHQDNEPYNHPIYQPMPSRHEYPLSVKGDQNRSKSNKIEGEMAIFGLEILDLPRRPALLK